MFFNRYAKSSKKQSKYQKIKMIFAKCSSANWLCLTELSVKANLVHAAPTAVLLLTKLGNVPTSPTLPTLLSATIVAARATLQRIVARRDPTTMMEPRQTRLMKRYFFFLLYYMFFFCFHLNCYFLI